MKKLATSTLLVTALSILFFSCSREAGISLTKRHYRSGYYVERNHSMPVQAKSVESKLSSDKKDAQSITAVPQTPRHEDAKPVITKMSDKITDKTETPKRLVRSIKATSDEVYNRFSTDKKTVTKPVENKYMFTDNSEMLRSSSSHGSLLWIIIILLVVLWVVSYSSGGWGLGGLLYLLLVIAVVLLILRLLGVL